MSAFEAFAYVVIAPLALALICDWRMKVLRRNRYLPRWRVALRRWIRQRNERKLKREVMNWRRGWQR